jgi:hypothetical protein
VSHRGAARTLMLLLRSTYLEGPFANEVVRRAVRSIHTHGDRTHGDRAGRHLPTCREPRRSTKQPDSAGRVEVKHRLPPSSPAARGGETPVGAGQERWPARSTEAGASTAQLDALEGGESQHRLHSKHAVVRCRGMSQYKRCTVHSFSS